MSKLLTVAARYARPAYEMAEEKGITASFIQELQAVGQAMDERPELLQLLKSPLITSQEKSSLIEGILGPKSSHLSRQFLNLLVKKNRIEFFSDIVSHINQIANDVQKIEEAVAITAHDLHPSILQLLQKALEKVTSKKIILCTETNPEVLGGIRIHIGNRLIDGTLKTKLKLLKSHLRAVRHSTT